MSADSFSNVLLFGDQTDSWVDSLDEIYQDASTKPWLQLFLSDLTAAISAEVKASNLDRALAESLGHFSSLQELGERYRNATDRYGMARCLLLHTVRAATLLLIVHENPDFLTPQHRPECLGISGGLLSLSAFCVSDSFQKLSEACLHIGRLLVRVCKFTSVRSRIIEDQPGAWGWAVLGISSNDLSVALERFQQTAGVPIVKRAQIGVVGAGWTSIIGPPSVLERFVSQSPAVKKLSKNRLDISALQHCISTTEHDLDYIVGADSPLLKQSLCSASHRIWGMDEPSVSYSSWRSLLRAICKQVLSQPLDIPQALGKLASALPSQATATVLSIGSCSHAPYITKALTAEHRKVTLMQKSMMSPAQPSEQSGRGGSRIAIVGMAGRGPGSDDLDQFWEIIMSQRDMATDVPPDRYDVDEYYCKEHGKDKRCKMTTRYGCFMDKPGHFDNRFFHISPREAMLMDPGHRQFLMSSYEALEMAGYSNGPTKTTNPNRIATFYGQCSDDWHSTAHPQLGCDSYTLQGVQRAFGPGRLAWQMKWEGPTYSLDSACASTSASIHLACMSLLSKDIDMAVAGAANILSTPHSFTCLSMSGVLSDTGNCKTYRDDADGYCRADFVGSVVLKRLEDAVADNDNVLAVIAASGRNHSGNSTSITTSDAGAQERLFRKIMRNAQVSPKDVDYVEMHGTGTQIGDPAEMGAVASIFKDRRREDGPLNVGSTKANFGHSEAAAGMASLLKSIRMFQEDTIPPQAGMPHTLNPNFPPLAELNIAIPSEAIPWPAAGTGSTRRILLNNFDAAGGNACMLLEDFPERNKSGTDPRDHHVVVTSARTPAAHTANKVRLLAWLRSQPTASIEDLAYTTTARRLHHSIRTSYIVSTCDELVSKLQAELDSEPPKPVTSKQSVIFVFTGQGSHFSGMGSKLYTTSAVFRETVELCAYLCSQHGFAAYTDLITNPKVDISSRSTMEIQLAVLTLEIGLAAFWKSVGVVPSMVIGHSLGEYAALHVAGVLSLADALYLVGRRASLLMERCEADTYAMLSVNLSAKEARELLNMNPKLRSGAVACLNSPSATVISGSKDDILGLQSGLTVSSKVLKVPYGFHSHQVDSVLVEFTSLAEAVTYSPPQIPVASTLLGGLVERSGTFNARYLAQQTRQAVNFIGGVEAIIDSVENPFWLELGPIPICSSFIQSIVRPTPSAMNIVSTLDTSRTDGTWKSVSKCLGAMYSLGADIDWLEFHNPYSTALKLLTLPTYAWDVKDYWLTFTEPRNTLQGGADKPESASAPQPMISTCAQYVLHQASDTSKTEMTFRASLADPGLIAITEGHKMVDLPIAPGSVFCEAAFAGAVYALEVMGRKDDARVVCLQLHNPVMARPLTNQLVGPDGNFDTTIFVDKRFPNDIRVSWKAVSASSSSRKTSSYSLGTCSLTVNVDTQSLQSNWERLSYFIQSRIDIIRQDVQKGSGHRFNASIFYLLFGQKVQYESSFKCVKEAFISDDFSEATAEVTLQDHPQGTRFVASPYWGEAVTHLAGFAVNANPANMSPDYSFINSGFESFEQTNEFIAGNTYFVYVRVSIKDEENRMCDIFVFDSDRKPIAQCVQLSFHRISNAVLAQALGGNSQRPRAPSVETVRASQSIQTGPNPTIVDLTIPTQVDDPVSGILDHFDAAEVVLRTIAEETGIAVTELSDETVISELGVDSIMAIEITSRVSEITGHDLVPSFLSEHPSVADVRRALGSSSSPLAPSSAASSAPATQASTRRNSRPDSPVSSIEDTRDEDVQTDGPETKVAISKKLSTVKIQPIAEVVDDGSPLPSTRVTLLQGKAPKNGQGPLPFYFIADGTGSIATYIHIPPFKTQRAVYGIDSPYLRCPSRLTTDVGIPGMAKLIVEAMVKKQAPGVPFLVGGFSGGAMVAYEVCCQLKSSGHTVEGLMLIDMCSPRATKVDDRRDIGLAMFDAISGQDQSGVWTTSEGTSSHLSQVFAAVAAYNPPRGGEPVSKRTAIVWAEKGLIDRCSESERLMNLLTEAKIATKRYDGYMEDPKFGAVAWSLPNKAEADLGPNGWDHYLGGCDNLLCMSVPADHLEMPTPAYAREMGEAMEKGLAFLTS